MEPNPRAKHLYTLSAGGKLLLHLHHGQGRVWQSRKRFILMLAGTQGGKTSFGPWWLWREIYGGYGFEGRGGGDYLAVTTSFDLFKLKMLPEMRRVFEEVMKCGKFWPGDRVIELMDPETGKFKAEHPSDEMWGRIILRSAVAPSGLEASTAKAAWLDEVGQDEWDLSVWEAILRRLSLNEGRVLGTTTIYNLGWVKSEWYDRWSAGDNDYDVVQFASVINPAFPRTEFERAAKSLPDWRFKMFYEGEFAHPEGLIYAVLQDHMIVEPFAPPLHWPRVMGIDFGGINTANLILAQDPASGLWYAYDEFLGGNMSTRDHAQRVQMKMAGCSDVRYAGGTGSEIQERMDWNSYGIPVVTPLLGDVEVGIANVIDLIKQDKFRVMLSCSGLRHEFATYHRKVNPDGTTSNVIDRKEDFHRLDALRYAASLINIPVSPDAWIEAIQKDMQNTAAQDPFRMPERGTWDRPVRFG